MNEIELTEQFQTKDTLIKRLKEENEKLSGEFNLVVSENKDYETILGKTYIKLDKANEDAERLYDTLNYIINEEPTGLNETIYDEGKTNLKAHEERIT